MQSIVVGENVVTLGLLHIRGRDAAAFLQGQLSNDVNALATGSMQLAGYHNPQGRVIALLRLVRTGAEDISALLPQELAAPVAERLRRYVLRARLTIDVLDAAAAATAAATLPAGTTVTRSRLADIAAGLPQVYAATAEQFVAQMLNLDCVGAISFAKGCYTGQEIIARAHYRGRVKRRMQRFVTTAGAAQAAAGTAAASLLVPGARLRLRDGRQLDVVDAAVRDDGRIEFLAVAPLAGAATEAAPAPPEPLPAGSAAPGTDAPPLIDCEPLPLPYALPE